MAEEKQEVKTFLIKMKCDYCDTGEMKPNGITLLSNPAKYTHVCTNCKATETYSKHYPYMEYETIGDSVVY